MFKKTSKEKQLDAFSSVPNMLEGSSLKQYIDQGQQVEKVYLDGAYQSPANDTYCENIDVVFTGYLTSQTGVHPILSRTFSIASFISVIINFYVFL